jgi:hypothetical protein
MSQFLPLLSRFTPRSAIREIRSISQIRQPGHDDEGNSKRIERIARIERNDLLWPRSSCHHDPRNPQGRQQTAGHE